MKTIQVVIPPKGETRVETKGFAGSECRDASKFLESALGARIDESLTDEFYQVEQQPQQNQLRT